MPAPRLGYRIATSAGASVRPGSIVGRCTGPAAGSGRGAGAPPPAQAAPRSTSTVRQAVGIGYGSSVEVPSSVTVTGIGSGSWATVIARFCSAVKLLPSRVPSPPMKNWLVPVEVPAMLMDP